MRAESGSKRRSGAWRGCLLVLAVPIVAGVVHLALPDGGSDAPGEPSAAASAAARAAHGKERRADDTVVADAPPGLAGPALKELAQRFVSSVENSTLDWHTAYGAIEDTGDGHGYTAGIIGFCTGTDDLLTLVERYTEAHPDNGLARYLPALRAVNGSDSHEGLDPGFTSAWRAEARVKAFREAQEEERDRVYFDPAVRLAKLDGLGALGQLVYYDAMVLHGPGLDADGFYGLREKALQRADLPSDGGSRKDYLNAFLDVRRAAIERSGADRPHGDTSRIDTALRTFVDKGYFELRTPLEWRVYGERYRVDHVS
ncbi:chitosanase [Streptomyces jietaisiensis]|uniref:Chitosanase n=2 Tax=Streptomyces griseoaurantiacus TaxID=68213 RepID=A0A7W2HUP8_9ACTN|nr:MULTISPECIES: chitosanase [Streptomyces]MBA5222294.1 chitosanase [Streptomyces griseoaurantiacus]